MEAGAQAEGCACKHWQWATGAWAMCGPALGAGDVRCSGYESAIWFGAEGVLL